jgi:hypothetical protein
MADTAFAEPSLPSTIFCFIRIPNGRFHHRRIEGKAGKRKVPAQIAADNRPGRRLTMFMDLAGVQSC